LKNYEESFGFREKSETHGSSLFATIITLKLLKRLNLLNQNKILYWIMNRLSYEGFEGRVNKHKGSDSCYFFWLGGSLKTLNKLDFVNFNQAKEVLFAY